MMPEERSSALFALGEETAFGEIKGLLERSRRNNANLGMCQHPFAQHPAYGAHAHPVSPGRQTHAQRGFLAQQLSTRQWYRDAFAT